MSVGRFCMLLSGCDVPRLFLYIPLVAYPGSFDSGTVYVARASLRQTRNRRNTQLLHNTHTTKRSKDFVPVYFQHPFKVQVQELFNLGGDTNCTFHFSDPGRLGRLCLRL